VSTPVVATRRSLVRRLKSVTAACVTGVLLATLTQQVPALAEPVPDGGGGLPERRAEEISPVPVREVTPAATAQAPELAVAGDRPAPVWPAAGTGVAAVPAAPVPQAPGQLTPDGGVVQPAPPVVVGGLPVRAEGATGPAPGRVQVEVFDRAATARAGVTGVLLRATPQDAAGRLATDTRSVRLSVDYAAFATGYGADWASRLRLVAMPECALSTPDSRECSGRPLLSDNNLTARTVSAAVPLDGGSVLVAVAAGSSGPAGDYSATSLQPSSTWTAGGNSGGFTWSYPIRVPPGVGGPTPSVGLSYASQAVDGRHAASNNQPSWIGEGFEAWPGGFIERRYKTCADDMAGSANNDEETGDLCWVRNNAVLSLNGTSGELIYNASEDRWHLRSEDGSRIERRTGASNGDDNGEYWVVTTTDGTQYWFGVNRLPGWATGDPTTSSTWTVPVFGNHSGDPCHATAFADSDCTQAWRWNLDYVVDVHGNSMSYWYATESNKYARNLDTADDATYIRGGYLRHISYGTRRVSGVDSVLDTDAPAQVVFATGDRCLSGCTTHDETRWPDTPWDQECTATSCDTFAPTFWTTKRLATITTRVRNGSAYRNVERWTFTYTFPDPGDTTRAGLWLSRISHEGLAAGTVSVPDIRFTPVSLDNRVDAIDHSPAMAWHRIARIETETGGAVALTYSERDCESSKPTLHTNTSRCYPVYWTPEGETDPVLDWFHKYLVEELREVDMVGGQPEILHDYDYLGGAAWHYTDDDGLIEDEARTWSVWRGYGRVTETVGEGDTRQTYTETRYFRGMHGDKLPSGTRNVNVTDSNGGTWRDDDWFAGMVREQITFDGPGGAEVGGQINDPWASSPTASRTIDGTTVHARFTNTATVWSRTALDGGRPERVTRVTTTFDSLGMPTQVDDYGAATVPGDEQCTKHTYTPRNTGAWVMDKVHRTRSFAVGCSATADPTSLGDDDVITEVRNWYDTATSFGVAPTRGLATRAEEMSEWNAGVPTYVTTGTAIYDAHGRVTETRDALDRPTQAAYTPATGGPITGSTITNALGHVSTSTLDPAYGLATRVVDPNGKTTNMTYDGLGRLTAVWLPGRSPTTQTANLTFAYGVRNTNVTFVTSRRLNARENYVTSHSLFDGLLRELQSQAPSPSVDGGRILTNTFYDNAGRAYLSYGSYYATGNPSTSLHVPIEPLNVPTQSQILFDGAGRTKAEIFQPYNVERWRTTTGYGGDRIDTTPPAGGTATSTINDARGRTVELRQYQTPTPTGSSFDTTSYDYDRKGQLVGVTDPAGNEWRYVYDMRGRQIEAHDPDAGLTRKEYDDADQMVGVIDGRNTHRLWYNYDELGRKVQEYRDVSGDVLLAAWTYDTVAKGQPYESIRWSTMLRLRLPPPANPSLDTVLGQLRHGTQHRWARRTGTLPAVLDLRQGRKPALPDRSPHDWRPDHYLHIPASRRCPAAHPDVRDHRWYDE
jgi:YD repeat-containing protein